MGIPSRISLEFSAEVASETRTVGFVLEMHPEIIEEFSWQFLETFLAEILH